MRVYACEVLDPVQIPSFYWGADADSFTVWDPGVKNWYAPRKGSKNVWVPFRSAWNENSWDPIFDEILETIPDVGVTGITYRPGYLVGNGQGLVVRNAQYGILHHTDESVFSDSRIDDMGVGLATARWEKLDDVRVGLADRIRPPGEAEMVEALKRGL